MPLQEIISRRITGINPFNELPVDAEIWREAHNHHHLHRQVHALAAHRPGIVTGLEVVASRSKERTVVVARGVGIDPEGRTVTLAQPVSFTLVEAQWIYIVLSFQQALDRDSALTVGGGQQYFREIEGHDLTNTRELPSKPYLELARLYRSNADAPITDAANPFSPARDELNLLYRPLAFPHCYADITVGELSYVPKTGGSRWDPNRAGLWNLLREGNGRGFHLTYTGPANAQLRAPAAGAALPVLLYVAGSQDFQALADAEVEGLRRFLDAGGLLFGEATGGSQEFANGFTELSQKLGANLQPVTKGHPLLTAHHVFSAPPPGAQGRGSLSLDAEAGVLFGTYDYGGAWQGDIAQPDAADARERIRQAQEFGLNVVAHAARRQRLREIAKFG